MSAERTATLRPRLAAAQEALAAALEEACEIDVQGAAAVLERVPDAVSIFILPPSFDVLRARLTARATEGCDDLALRLRNSLSEVSQYTRFKYVVVNDEVTSAARKLGAIILAERQRRDRQNDLIQGILDSFELSKL